MIYFVFLVPFVNIQLTKTSNADELITHKLLLTAVMTSKPASLSELTARLLGAKLVVSSDDIIISVDGEARSPVNSVSRRK